MDPSHPRFCDWHVFVNPLCVDYAFFRITFFVFLGIISLTICLLLYTVVFRIFALKESKTSFFSGLNRSLLLFLFARFSGLIHLSMALSGADRIATEIMFVVYNIIGLFPMFNHLSMIIEAIPGLKTSHFKVPEFILNPKIRAALFMTYQTVVVFITSGVLLGVSEHYLLVGQNELSDGLWVAGFAFFATFGAAIPFSLFSFFFYHFKKASAARLEAIQGSNVRTDKRETKLLLLTIDKINKTFYALFPVVGIIGIFFVILASYHNFFFDLGLSKAFCILILSTEILALLLSLHYLKTDYIKLHAKKGGSSDYSNSHSNSHSHSHSTSQHKMRESKDESSHQEMPKDEKDPIDHFLEVAKSGDEEEN